MKCCSHEVVTAFCPNCGKPIGGDPLSEILTHVRGLKKTAESTRDRGRQWDAENPERAEDYSRLQRRAAAERKVAKFERWLVALETLKTATETKGKENHQCN